MFVSKREARTPSTPISKILALIAIAVFAFAALGCSGSFESTSAAPSSSSASEIPAPTHEEELMTKLVGYWDGTDEGNTPMTLEFFSDGTCVIGYNGKENADGGKHWIEGDTLYIQGRVSNEPYEYGISFVNNDKALAMTDIGVTGKTIMFNRAEKPTATSTPAPAPAPAPAQTQSPYEKLAGTWSGSTQDGFPIQYKFGTDQHFYVGEDGDWYDDGPYTISGDTLTLNGMNGTDTYTLSYKDDNNIVLEIPGASAYFYFTRIG